MSKYIILQYSSNINHSHLNILNIFIHSDYIGNQLDVIVAAYVKNCKIYIIKRTGWKYFFVK